MKRIIAILLLGLILTSCAADNAGNGTNTQTSASSASTEIHQTTEEEQSLPETDFGGYEFRILTYDNMVGEHRAEELNGELINDAVFSRNSYVSEKYNIKIKVSDMDNASYKTALSKNISSGEDAYDLYQIFLSAAATIFVPTGAFVDWNTIPYVSENLDKPWWNQSGLEKLRFNGANYLLNGDICHLTLGNATGLLFNKKLFDAKGIEYPYSAVTDGVWTLDGLLTICGDGNSDLNGDGKIKLDDDYYSFLSTKWIAPIGLSVGCDLNTLIYDESGYPNLNFYTDRTISAYEKIYKLIVESDSPLGEYNSSLLETDSFKLFSEDRALIVATGMLVPSILRGMTSDFGIIPYPKYDEKQEQYLSSIDAGSSSAAVAVTATHLSRTGLIVEALCEKGSELVIPAYYDLTLQGKVSRDNDSAAMLDIIKNSACFDPLYVYNFGGLGFAFIDWLSTKKTDISSAYTKAEKKAVLEIASLWDSVTAE